MILYFGRCRNEETEFNPMYKMMDLSLLRYLKFLRHPDPLGQRRVRIEQPLYPRLRAYLGQVEAFCGWDFLLLNLYHRKMPVGEAGYG